MDSVIPLGVEAYKRAYAGAPEVKLVNRFLEKSPTNLVEGVTLLGRPGTARLFALPTLPLYGCFYRQGLLSNNLIIVSGTTLYRYAAGVATAATGTLATDTNGLRFAWSKGAGYEYLFISCGGSLYVYNPTTNAVTAVAVPAGQAVAALEELGSFILVGVRNSRRFYFIRPGEITIDALDYAEKESAPDPITEIQALGDIVYLFGTETTETWYQTGDLDAPFVPSRGNTIPHGAREGTVSPVGAAVLFVGNDNVVYSLPSLSPVSRPGINERLRGYTGSFALYRSWSFSFDGHTFYVLYILGAGTFVYDESTGEWCQFLTKSDGDTAAAVGGETVFIPDLTAPWTAVNGTAYGLSVVACEISEAYILGISDAQMDGVNFIPRVVTGGVQTRSRDKRSVGSVRATANLAVLSRIFLRWSDDDGATWSSYYSSQLYAGEYAWRSLGSFAAPGRIFEFTDNGGPARIDGATLTIEGDDQ